MILVDTSVLVDLFKGVSNGPADRMREVLVHKIPFGITSVIYQELLQGAASEKEYNVLQDYLSTQTFFHPQDPLNTYEDAARIYFSCRKRGITIRSTIDCLVAQVALEHDLLLLHNDKDFSKMAPIIGLRLY
jgi:predicted nucleic acid-binding protein